MKDDDFNSYDESQIDENVEEASYSSDDEPDQLLDMGFDPDANEID
eukprot:CAMPEP_0116881528 /NCGR_PEP_ID=MMETSP0463-20121206/13626_1 /TAXON_ID=181622 /ORGANISM="Strombidinopsis sp, Strain SopsisLIS2011" /LENGTH=45 /DNA_ID= /DNA_START= /DNA_END= /DNA_ORIENTATION=